jgi:hypothetical protein
VTVSESALHEPSLWTDFGRVKVKGLEFGDGWPNSADRHEE